jgi:hypothetical protein
MRFALGALCENRKLSLLLDTSPHRVRREGRRNTSCRHGENSTPSRRRERRTRTHSLRAGMFLRRPWPTAQGLEPALPTEAVYHPREVAPLRSKLRCDGASHEDRGSAAGWGRSCCLRLLGVESWMGRRRDMPWGSPGPLEEEEEGVAHDEVECDLHFTCSHGLEKSIYRDT